MEHFQTKCFPTFLNVESVSEMLQLTKFLSLNPQLAQYEPPQDEKLGE